MEKQGICGAVLRPKAWRKRGEDARRRRRYTGLRNSAIQVGLAYLAVPDAPAAGGAYQSVCGTIFGLAGSPK